VNLESKETNAPKLKSRINDSSRKSQIKYRKVAVALDEAQNYKRCSNIYMTEPFHQLYHNPRCSKSRATNRILEDQGVAYEVIEYLKDTPSPAELDELCKKLGVEPQQIIRNKEKRFKELGLSVKDPLSRNQWLKILSDNPILIERPIFVMGDKAVIGRPPENVLDLLN
jgi:arsenate reductase (glutaredoxin)